MFCVLLLLLLLLFCWCVCVFVLSRTSSGLTGFLRVLSRYVTMSNDGYAFDDSRVVASCEMDAFNHPDRQRWGCQYRYQGGSKQGGCQYVWASSRRKRKMAFFPLFINTEIDPST